MRSIAALAVVVLCCHLRVEAADMLFVGPGASFEDAANWNTSSVPGAGDRAFVRDCHDVAMAGTYTLEALDVDHSDSACTGTPTFTLSGSLTSPENNIQHVDAIVSGLWDGLGSTVLEWGVGSLEVELGVLAGMNVIELEARNPSTLNNVEVQFLTTAAVAGTDPVRMRGVTVTAELEIGVLVEACDLSGTIRTLTGSGSAPVLRWFDSVDCGPSVKWSLNLEAVSGSMLRSVGTGPFLLQDGIVQGTGGDVSFTTAPLQLEGTILSVNDSVIAGNSLIVGEGSQFVAESGTVWEGATVITGDGSITVRGRIAPGANAGSPPGAGPDIGRWGMAVTSSGSVTLGPRAVVALEMVNATADFLIAPELDWEDGALVEVDMSGVLPAAFSAETEIVLIEAEKMVGNEDGLALNTTNVPANMPCFRYDCVIGTGLVLTVGCDGSQAGDFECILIVEPPPFPWALVGIITLGALFGLGFIYMIFSLVTGTPAEVKSKPAPAEDYTFKAASPSPTPPKQVLRPPGALGGPQPTMAGTVPPASNMIAPGQGPMAGAIPVGQMHAGHQGVDPSFARATMDIMAEQGGGSPHMGVDPAFGNVGPAAGGGPAPHMGVDPAFGNVTPAAAAGGGSAPHMGVDPAFGNVTPARSGVSPTEGLRRPAAPPPAALSGRRPSQGGGRRPSAGAKGGRGNDFGDAAPARRRPSQGGGRRPSAGAKGGHGNDFGEVGGKGTKTGGAGRGRGRGRGRGALPPPGGRPGGDDVGAPLMGAASPEVFGDADEDPPTERSKGSANSRNRGRRPSAGGRKGSVSKASGRGGRKGSSGLRKGSVSRAKKVTNAPVPEADY